MTYEEIKRRLTKCEKSLTKLKQTDLSNSTARDRQQAQKAYKVLNESIQKYKSLLLKEEKTYILTPKSGKPSAASLGDDEVEALKDADDIAAIKSADGEEIKEQVEFSVEETKAIAKSVGKAVAKGLNALGDQIKSMKAHRIEPNSFDISVNYKGEGPEDEFSFYITDDTLHLVDFSFDKELVDVGVKPSGEAIVNVDVLANELQKHWKSMNEERKYSAEELDRLDLIAHREFNNKDFNQLSDEEKQKVLAQKDKVGVKEGAGKHYIKVTRRQYKDTMHFLDNNQYGADVADITDDDGAGNVIIYFKDGDNLYDIVMDLGAFDIDVVDHSADMDEARDINDPAMVKFRAAKMKRDKFAGSDPKAGSTIKSTGFDPIILKLKAKRAQIMRDMEQEAEPEGGPIADKYGDMLNKIDAAIAKARGKKEPTYGLTKEGQPTVFDDESMDALRDIILKYVEDPDDAEKLVQQVDDHGLDSLPSDIEAQLERDPEFEAWYHKLHYGNDADTDYMQRRRAEKDYIKEWGSSDQHAMNQSIHRDLGEPTEFPGLSKLMDAAEDAVDFYWDDWEEYKTDREGLVMHAAQLYARKMFPEFMKMAAKMVEPANEARQKPSKGHRGGVGKLQKAHGLVVAKMKELAKQYKAGDKSVVDQLKDLTAKKKQLEKDLDKAVAGTNRNQQLAELSGDQQEAIYELQNILDQAAGLGDEAREIIRQHFPNMLSKGDAYGAFEFGSSANRYDTTLESMIDEIQEYYDEEEDIDESKEKEGQMAASKGKKYSENPYEKGTKDHLDWSKGHNSSRARKLSSADEGKYKSDAQRKAVHASKAEKGQLNEFTDERFSGAELIDNISKNSPDMFGKQLFADLLPKGVASEDEAVKALHAHDNSRIKQRMGARLAPMFVHVQYHELEHEGESYRLHNRQYYNSNYKDNDPDFNPAVSELTLMKVNKETDKGENLGSILVKTDAYVQDVRDLESQGKLGKRHMEESHTGNPNDKYVVRPCKNKKEPWAVWEGEKRVKGFAEKKDAQAYADKQNKKQGLNEQATCCGKCGRVHVKGSGCKRPYLKGKDHCRYN